MLQVDAGDMLWTRPKVNERERPQREAKAKLLFAASALLGVDALGVGDGDMAFGLDFIEAGAKEHDLPYVSANLARVGGELVFPATRVVERAGMKIGLTSVLLDTHSFKDVELLPVDESLRSALTHLRDSEQVDLVVVLSGLGQDGDKEMVKRVAGIDVVFGSHTRKFQTDPLIIGSTAIFEAGSRSKYVGEVEFEFRAGKSGWSNEAGRASALRRQEQLQTQLDRYDEQIASAPDESARGRVERMRGMSQRRYDAIYVPPADDGTTHVITGKKVPMGKDLADHAEMKGLVDATLETLGDAPASHGRETSRREYGSYVFASGCLACHRDQYTDWKATGHARAYRTLVTEKRQFDDDCWSCHVTGAKKPGGPAGPKEIGPMRNVQCEACHGPGKEHSSNPTGVDMKKSPGEALCLECHTEEQTEGSFVYSEYLPKVDHVD